jgi:hypothetical protein
LTPAVAASSIAALQSEREKGKTEMSEHPQHHESELAYEAPEVRDYGDLVELTAATAFTGPEDGGSKLLIHHTVPTV